jgi:lysophospholipid acyltransferase (LPLAT)-like uncharacterized protein
MKIRSRFLNQIAGATLGGFTRLLASSVKFEMHMEDPAWYPLAADCPRTYIVSTWHDTMLLPIMLRRTIREKTPENRMVTLVSQHQDGSFLTYAMRHFYLGTVRGSTNRGGATALRALIEEAQQQHICITPDGPRGPRRVISPGIIALSSLSQVPIIPCLFAASRSWCFKGSWTDLVLPKPFSTTHGVIGRPLQIPKGLSKDGIEHFRQQLQAEMDRLQPLAEAFARGESPALGEPTVADVKPQQRAA